MRCSRGASTSTCGACCRPPSSCSSSSPIAARGQAGALVSALLADDEKYAEHWISFWNDLLRNDDGVTYFSETAGRKSITDWLLPALKSNLPYDQFVARLLNPRAPADPDGFLDRRQLARRNERRRSRRGCRRRRTPRRSSSAINLKCNSCHDSFISKWKLKDAYALAAYFSPGPDAAALSLRRRAEPLRRAGFLFPEIEPRARRPASLADRRAAAAAIFTDPRNGRLPRTLVNRIWQRLLGRGIVANPDEMDGEPWSPELLDWLAERFRGARLRPQARDRRDRDVARVPDAGGAPHGRATGARTTCLRDPRFGA